MEQGTLTSEDAKRLLQGRITPEVRRLFNLRYCAYLSFREIAERLGKTCGDVRRKFHHLEEMVASR